MRHEKMAAWAGDEDAAILEMVVRHGPRWSKIAEDLPGRSVASVRNRYLRIQKGSQMRSEGAGKNRCHACTRRSTPPARPCLPLPQLRRRLSPPTLHVVAGGQMKLGHVCHAKVAKVAAAIPGPVLAPLALFPHIPAAGPAAMFSAIDSLLVAARLAPGRFEAASSAADSASARKQPRSPTNSEAPSAATAAYRAARESAPDLARSLAPAQALQLLCAGLPTAEEPMAEAEGGAVACLPVSCRSELVVTFANAAPARPVVVPLCARGTPQGPVDSRALGVDSPEFSRKPAQDEHEEQDAEMILVKKDPMVRQEFAA